VSRTLIAVLVVLGVFVLFVGGTVISALSWRSDAVSGEATIEAQYKQNQNNYDNMWKRIKEIAKVPGMYTEDLKKVWDGVMKARYGGDGSKAMWQWIKEHNPSLPAGMYTQLQRAIEAGRTSFAADQKALIDKKRVYQVHLKSNVGMIWSNVWGYPTIDLAKFDIVTSSKTEAAFDSKKDDKELELR